MPFALIGCSLCGQSCFVTDPRRPGSAYGSFNLLRTCAAGQASDRSQLGYCWDDVQRESGPRQNETPKAESGKPAEGNAAGNATPSQDFQPNDPAGLDPPLATFVPLALVEELAAAAALMLSVPAPPRLHPLHVAALTLLFQIGSDRAIQTMVTAARSSLEPLLALDSDSHSFVALVKAAELPPIFYPGYRRPLPRVERLPIERVYAAMGGLPSPAQG